MMVFGCVLAAVLPLASLAAEAYPYGVNAHLTRNEFGNHEQALQMMASGRIRQPAGGLAERGQPHVLPAIVSRGRT